MSIKNISIENSNITANKGLICIEGENITLKNVNLLTRNSKVMQVQNSRNITLEQIGYQAEKEVLLEINGERSENVSLTKTDFRNVKSKVIFSNKAGKKAFSDK